MFQFGGTRSPLSLNTTPPGPAPPTPTGYFSSPSSPPFSPSSNGPHDVSIEASGSIPFSFGGLRSPGKTSPLRGRNVKEYDEQLDHLKKENFSLKLRIYFLEDKIGYKGIKEDKEELHKANIELKVETEALKQQLSDKQELVRQAAGLLKTLESQFNEQLQSAHEAHYREAEGLKDTIATLQKNLDDYSERARQDGGGDLTRLCGLAFSCGPEDSIDLSLSRNVMADHHNNTPPHLQGVFSMHGPSDCGPKERSPDFALHGNSREIIPESAKTRIQALEEEVDKLTTKVKDLQETLQDKERVSQALKEDIVNLKNEIEDREDKLSDLEQEVVEKDQKVDQLMQELETRHLEIEAKDSTIQTLHDDLNKVEPQIEVKVQEIIERDRIIEEKKEQLQQQNKILVEIQITLDEKQKQIAELEESLSEARQNVDKLKNEFDFSIKTITDISDEVVTRDKVIAQLKKELKRKEKKVKDLLAELKEALDMLKKAKWEAETNGGQDGVKEMVEEENERLWAELEQRKLDMMNLRAESEASKKEAKDREDVLKKQKEEAEERLRALQKLIDSEVTGERERKYVNEDAAELLLLKEKVESRDGVLKSQEVAIEALKSDLMKTKEELVEKKDELKHLKKELTSKDADVHDFLSKELFGKSKDLRDLQNKLCSMSMSQDSPLEALKLFFESNPMKYIPEGSSKAYQQQMQMRSNSLSKLSEQPLTMSAEKERSPTQTSKAGRSNSFSLLENLLYANMGQKVVNTNQTFNTYVLSGDAEQEGFIAQNEISSAIPTETRKMKFEAQVDPNDPGKLLLASILGKGLGKNAKKCAPLTTAEGYKTDAELEICSLPISPSMSENTLQIIYQEVSNIKNEAHALKKDREVLTEKVAALQALNEQLSTKGVDQTDSEANDLMNRLEDKKESFRNDHCEVALELRSQVETLKAGMKESKRNVTLQMLQMASSKYQESLKNYKQEIISLRKRLADSHNACDLLRNRLEELVDFFEQILDMDRKGIISLSHLSFAQRSSLQKSLEDSRSLSHSLSHSLMIGTDSLLGDTLSSFNDEEASRFCLPLESLSEEMDFSQLEGPYEGEDCSKDVTNDFVYYAFAAKINSQIDNQSREIEAVVAKLNHLCDQMKMKDDKIQAQSDTVAYLQNLLVRLREEAQLRDRLQVDDKTSETTLSLGEDSDILPDIEIQSDTNLSLHLSALQYSLPSPDFNSKFYSGLFTVPVESSTSDILPPLPPSQPSPQESYASNISAEKLPKTIDSATKPLVYSQSDIGSAYSTDIIVKSLTKQNDISVSKSNYALDEPQIHGESLEQPTIPPSFALASPSESEAWSEPDRNVSLARIGLDTCNLVSTSHDRSLSRSRMTRSAPFTSESDGEGNLEETKEGSAGLGTPSTKPKRRTDIAEVKRLSAKLKTVEQLNETLRAELHIYQTLSQQFSVSKERDTSTRPDIHNSSKSEGTKDNGNVGQPMDSNESSCSLIIPSSLLQEIRSLRMKLEEAIANNDLLRDQLEAALSGYLSEETRNLTSSLSVVQQELKINQEKLSIATNSEQQLRAQVKEQEARMFELGERLADYMTCNQKLEKRVNDLNQELLKSREVVSKTEEELQFLQTLRKEMEFAHKEFVDSKDLQVEMEVNSLKLEYKKLQQSEKEKERKIEEQKKYIQGLEEAKLDYESRFSEQDSAINELCKSITALQQDNGKSSLSDHLVPKLQEALQNSEGRLLQVTKERFALLGENARLKAQLASVMTHANLLQREVRELSVSEDISVGSDAENKQFMQKLKAAMITIKEMLQDKELFKAEKKAMQKEIELMQEEILTLKAHLDHVLSREAVTNSREIRELASLQMSYECLKEKHISLANLYKNIISEKNSLEEKIKESFGKEKEIDQLRKSLYENHTKKEEVLSQLEAERCLTRNLQIQIKNLQSDSYPNVPSDIGFGSINATQTDFIRPDDKMPFAKLGKTIVSPLKESSSLSWSEDKENRYPRSRATLSLPLIEDDVTSADSPDLGIGSDGQFSSLERLGGVNVTVTGSQFSQKIYTMEGKKEERTNKLCSEPSHSQLISEIERLSEERKELSIKLASTKESLKEALHQLSKANQKKESVERAICRQLTKTHNVLIRAKGNLSHAKDRSGNKQKPSTYDDKPQETG